MALQTYADLQTSVASWLHRADLASVIPDFITLGEQKIYRALRVRQNEVAISDVISSSGTWALPADYVDLKYLRIVASPNVSLDRKSAEWIYANDPWRTSGIPKYMARDVDSLIFSPSPASQYTIKGAYYKRLDPISTTLNTVFTGNSGLWLFAALAESAPYLKNDPRIAVWEAKFTSIMLEVNAEENRENTSGSRLSMVPASMTLTS